MSEGVTPRRTESLTPRWPFWTCSIAASGRTHRQCIRSRPWPTLERLLDQTPERKRRDGLNPGCSEAEARYLSGGIVKFTAQRKTTFHSAGTSPGSEALTSRVGRDNGLELT